MKTFILVRHGESEANVSKTFAGQLDVPLTETGYEQARRMAQYLDKYHIDKIYASPLRRAYDTAAAIAARQNCAIETDDALMEINSGEWQGLSYAEIAQRYLQTYQLWRTDIGNAAPEGGETCAELYARVTAFFEKLLQQKKGTFCLACHATPIRMIESYIRGNSAIMAKKIQWVPNASVSVYEYDGAFHEVERGSCGYLAELVTTLPETI